MWAGRKQSWLSSTDYLFHLNSLPHTYGLTFDEA